MLCIKLRDLQLKRRIDAAVKNIAAYEHAAALESHEAPSQLVYTNHASQHVPEDVRVILERARAQGFAVLQADAWAAALHGIVTADEIRQQFSLAVSVGRLRRERVLHAEAQWRARSWFTRIFYAALGCYCCDVEDLTAWDEDAFAHSAVEWAVWQKCEKQRTQSRDRPRTISLPNVVTALPSQVVSATSLEASINVTALASDAVDLAVVY